MNFLTIDKLRFLLYNYYVNLQERDGTPMSKWDDFKKGIGNIADKTVGKTREITDTATIKIKIANKEADRDQEYRRLGKLTYAKLKKLNSTDSGELTAMISETMARIDKIMAEIAALQAREEEIKAAKEAEKAAKAAKRAAEEEEDEEEAAIIMDEFNNARVVAEEEYQKAKKAADDVK